MSRKLGPDDAKKRPVNVRMTDDLRAAVEAAAAQNDRSITQECEARLIASFRETSLERIIAEQMAKIIQPAVDEAVAKALTVIPEPAGSPPPAYRQ